MSSAPLVPELKPILKDAPMKPEYDLRPSWREFLPRAFAMFALVGLCVIAWVGTIWVTRMATLEESKAIVSVQLKHAKDEVAHLRAANERLSERYRSESMRRSLVDFDRKLDAIVDEVGPHLVSGEFFGDGPWRLELEWDTGATATVNIDDPEVYVKWRRDVRESIARTILREAQADYRKAALLSSMDIFGHLEPEGNNGGD